MTGNPLVAVEALNRRFFLDHPAEAAQQIEDMPISETAPFLVLQPVHVLVPVLEQMVSPAAAGLLPHFPNEKVRNLLSELNPNTAVALLAQLDREEHDRFLSFLDPLIERELRELMTYPEDRAGRLMDRRIGLFRETMTVAQAIKRLRGLKHRPLRTIFLVDEEQKLTSRVELVDLVVAEPGRKLYQLAQPVATAVNVFTPREEVVEHLEKTRLPNLPVIDSSGRLVGIVRHAELVKAVEEEAMADIQTMVGAGAEERALSKVFFSVRKRLPWLHINLLTAFLAAAVVGLFESTIARFTALAVLMPVVAGQAGNAGAQALAVTMRSLALREIGLRHGLGVLKKEFRVGGVNGLVLAAVTGAGVYFWSGSGGLALVIGLSMVVSMVAAGLAGALIPLALTRLGQDPAQSSSILLTTITDVVGFFSFLGIGTLLSGLL